jgi:sugar/nucleoside kinase (ribokinase family)
LGARLFSPAPLSRTVGWIVDQGKDFPQELTDQINHWQTSALIRRNLSRLTTRGWNGYDATERRSFRYATPKKRLTVEDLTPPLLQAKAFHLICSPLRCQELVNSLLSRRREAFDKTPNADAAEYTRPLIIWEPVPDLCVPDELLNCTNTLPLVDVCSPNHAELASFMGDDKGATDPATGRPNPAAVEHYAEQLLASMPLQSYTLVVRAGEAGCYIARNGGRKKKMVGNSNGNDSNTSAKKKKPQRSREHALRPDMDLEALFAGLLRDEDGCVAREEIEMDPGLGRWLPAYYGSGYPGGGESASKKVVDPTGGGNTFLGGLAVALARGKSIEEACAWGHVAASFAIEQTGFPVLTVDEEGKERWNGVRVEERLAEYQARL